MKNLLLVLVLLSQSACSFVVLSNGSILPKFAQGQQVQTVENKLKVFVIGTACDVRTEQRAFEQCRYLVKLPFKGDRTLMFEEDELEAIP